MNSSIAISVKNVSKTFKIPHERMDSFRGAFIGAVKTISPSSLFPKGEVSRLRDGGGKPYEIFKALDDVSFEVKKGEFFGIIGRNGSGKSTLLKVLAGIYQPDQGSVHINGLISPFLELGIGFNPELSGRDNVYLNATVLGLTKKQIDEKFDSIVAFSELERFIDQKLKNYSSGMQVRLAFSVSIHANRDILLMDEVLAVGDSNFQSKCLEEFVKYKKMGKTVLLVTHNIDIVKEYCDSALLLRGGRVERDGDVQEVLNLYSYENLSDKETVILKRENDSLRKNSYSDTRVSKNIKIKKVCFLDSKGAESSEFETGDNIKIRIFFEADSRLDGIVFGVSIDSDENVHVFGPNTKKSNFSMNNIYGRGYLDLNIIKNNLNKGVYFVTVGIYDWECIESYDLSLKKYVFKIITHDDTQDGVFRISYNWEKTSL